MVRFKNDVMHRLADGRGVRIELGCGSRKTNRDAIGIDVRDSPDVDIVGDACDALRTMPASSVEHVYSHHFMEHVADLYELMAELGRVVRGGGTMEVVVPHFSNPYYYSDPTHRSSFGLYTFSYLASSSPMRRRVPTYGIDPQFRLEAVRLRFKSSRPFLGRYAVKRAVGAIFDSCNYMRELYEENFCYLFPCYEIYYRLIRN